MTAAVHSSTVDSKTSDARRSQPRVAYMMSRFPKITETFILYEMLAAEESGAAVEVFPLRREHAQKIHPEAAAYVKRAHFLPLLSLEILRDNVSALLRQPGTWLRTLFTLVRSNLGCRRFLFGGLAIFPLSVSLARRMRNAQIDHIHAHFASHPAASAWIIHQLSGIPYSFVAHGSDLHRDQHMLREKVQDAAFVAAISQYNRQMILQHAGETCGGKVKVIHCGVNPDDFAGRSVPEDPDGPVKVVCIGTLHEVKGQRYLIEAVKTARAAGLDITLQLVGDGPDQQMLQELVTTLELTDSVVFAGRRDRHEIIALLKSADILVAPSVPSADGRREGIPVVLMEAMASGLPVISSRLSGIPELVEHNVNGLLLEPKDTDGIAHALQVLGNDPALRSKMGTAGRETIQDRFNLQASVRLVMREIKLTGATGTRETRP